MRLTQEIRRQILNNIVADHDVTLKAKAAMDASHNLAMDIIHDCMPEGVTTFAGLQDFKRERSKLLDCAFFRISIYQDSVDWRTKDGEIADVADAIFNVNLGGNSRTASVAGDNWHFRRYRGTTSPSYDDTFSPSVGHIVPGYELHLAKSVLEVIDGTHIPVYLPKMVPAYAAGHKFTKRQDEIDAMRREAYNEYLELKGAVMATLNKYGSDTKLVAAWPEVKPYLPAPVSTCTDVALDVKTLNEICGIPR